MPKKNVYPVNVMRVHKKSHREDYIAEKHEILSVTNQALAVTNSLRSLQSGFKQTSGSTRPVALTDTERLGPSGNVF